MSSLGSLLYPLAWRKHGERKQHRQESIGFLESYCTVSRQRCQNCYSLGTEQRASGPSCGGMRRSVFAYTDEIDAWLKTDSESASKSQVPENDVATSPVDPHHGFPRAVVACSRFLSRPYVAGILGLGLLIPGTLAVFWGIPEPKIQITRERQLTEDHFWKVGLVTNGRFLYFGESQNGQFKIAEIPAQGGPIRRLTMPFVQGIPLDISRDGKQLLVLAWETVPQDDRALWIVPLDGTVPRRVGSVMCHSAAWSPDGRQIAFAAEKTLYLTKDEGLTAEPIQTFDHVPGPLRWSLDGKRLRLEIQDERNERASFWQLTMDGDKNGRNISLAQLSLPGGQWTSTGGWPLPLAECSSESLPEARFSKYDAAERRPCRQRWFADGPAAARRTAPEYDARRTAAAIYQPSPSTNPGVRRFPNWKSHHRTTTPVWLESDSWIEGVGAAVSRGGWWAAKRIRLRLRNGYAFLSLHNELGQRGVTKARTPSQQRLASTKTFALGNRDPSLDSHQDKSSAAWSEGASPRNILATIERSGIRILGKITKFSARAASFGVTWTARSTSCGLSSNPSVPCMSARSSPRFRAIWA